MVRFQSVAGMQPSIETLGDWDTEAPESQSQDLYFHILPQAQFPPSSGFAYGGGGAEFTSLWGKL